MGKLEATASKEGAKLNLNIAGTIDEDADFSTIPIAGNAEIELNLQNLKSINSCGIREWIQWMGTAAGAKITFALCPKVIVDQINMVDGFLPANGSVASFFVPYYNDDSGAEKNVLFTYGKEFTESAVNPPKDIKDDEGNPMEMDVIEAKYFKFLKK